MVLAGGYVYFIAGRGTSYHRTYKNRGRFFHELTLRVIYQKYRFV